MANQTEYQQKGFRYGIDTVCSNGCHTARIIVSAAPGVDRAFAPPTVISLKEKYDDPAQCCSEAGEWMSEQIANGNISALTGEWTDSGGEQAG